MAKFHYTAERPSGETYRGEVQATDRFELYEILHRDGEKLISVEEQKKANLLSWRYWNAKFSTVPEQEKILFARNLSAMLTAGLPLMRALSVLGRQTRNAKFISLLSTLATDVRRGSSLTEALSSHPKVFSPLFIAMVRSGEESGQLPKALLTISEQMERMHTIKKKIKGAMIYPAIIIVAIIGIATLMLTQVVPTLAQTFEELDADLPATTRAIIGVSDFLLNNTVLALLLFVVVVGGIIMGLRTKRGKRMRDWVFIKIPLVGGIVKEVNAARTARTMGSLISSGVDMLSAISITSEVVQNSYFREILDTAHDEVERGKPLTRPFAEHEDLYPPLVGEMIAVGEETGQLAEMLGRLADYYEEEVARRTKDMSTVIEPFLMVIIGAAVGFFAVAMITPIYQLSENI